MIVLLNDDRDSSIATLNQNDKYTYMLEFKQLDLKTITNERATYSFCELKDYVDFDIKRVYYIQDCHEATGQHCHMEEKELFIMVRGTCTAVIDRGDGKEDIPFAGPGDAMYVGNHVWHGFKDFSEDAILLACSSTNYREDRSDYIEDYDAYVVERDKRKSI